MDIWVTIEDLEGLTLKTLDRKKPFRILSVDDSGIMILVTQTNKSRFISRSEIEGAFNELWLAGALSRADVRDRHSEANPAYVAAILADLPGVRYKLKPIRLFYERGDSGSI
jgi:hypothetical protein